MTRSALIKEEQNQTIKSYFYPLKLIEKYAKVDRPQFGKNSDLQKLLLTTTDVKNVKNSRNKDIISKA